MEQLYVYRRGSDGKTVTFFTTERHGRLTYLIREPNGQDSVTTDKSAMEDFRTKLTLEGYALVSE